MEEHGMPEPDAVPFKEYIDSQVAEIRRAVAIASVADPKGVELRDYIEAIFEEHRRAVLLGEQEREKAAAALRSALERSIAEGDTHLSAHIATQIEQIRAAFESAELLEMQRITTVQQRIDGVVREGGLRLDAVRSEIKLITEASATAIAKAESATERRFDAVDGTVNSLAAQINTFLPRETFESVVTGWGEWRVSIDRRLDEQAGARFERRSGRQGTTQNIGLVIAAISAVLAMLAIIASIVLATT
jgi:hypothetical protein